MTWATATQEEWLDRVREAYHEGFSDAQTLAIDAIHQGAVEDMKATLSSRLNTKLARCWEFSVSASYGKAK